MKTSPRPFVRRLAHLLWSDWIRPLALPLLLVVSAKSAVADLNFVPSGSMKPSILEGEVVFVNKLAYDLRVPFTTTRLARWAEPRRGDVVVCFAPDDGTRLVKRVVALPGDTVELRNEILFINGVRRDYAPLPEHAVRHLTAAERSAGVFARESDDDDGHAVMALPSIPAHRNFGPVRVPADTFFMLGDNRDNSRDSRFFGPIARREIIGEVNAIVASADPDRWLQPRLDRFFTALE